MAEASVMNVKGFVEHFFSLRGEWLEADREFFRNHD